MYASLDLQDDLRNNESKRSDFVQMLVVVGNFYFVIIKTT